MQLRPDAPTLLDAVTQFLLSELLPQVQDKALAFKVMIAASLTGTVALELKNEDALYVAEVGRLQTLLPGVVDGDARVRASHAERAEALMKLNGALAEGLRKRRFNDAQLKAITAHVRQTAMETLQATNPRFDTSAEID